MYYCDEADDISGIKSLLMNESKGSAILIRSQLKFSIVGSFLGDDHESILRYVF